MSFVPYLHFQGNCAEAMQFYADVFGAGDLQLMKYADAPDDVFPDGHKPADDGRVMHSSLTLGSAMLMASDFPPGITGDPQKAVSVAHMVPDAATGQAVFDRLLEGGGTELLASDGRVRGPGGQEVFLRDGAPWLAYHWYDRDQGGLPKLALTPLGFDEEGWPAIAPPQL